MKVVNEHANRDERGDLIRASNPARDNERLNKRAVKSPVFEPWPVQSLQVASVSAFGSPLGGYAPKNRHQKADNNQMEHLADSLKARVAWHELKDSVNP